MSAYVKGDGWTPAVELNLATAGTAAFEEARQRFAAWVKTQPEFGPVAMQNGWHDITPQIAEDLLRRNTSNRKPSLNIVKKYAKAMEIGEWKPTGQPILINAEGRLEDAAHRLLASYFAKLTFRSYVIVDVPVIEDLFAYIDDSKPRSAADALYTSGSNGLSHILAAAIKLAGRYDEGTLSILNQHKGTDMSVREVLAYARHNPGLSKTTHRLMQDYSTAIDVIGHKAVAVFFAWKVEEICGPEVLDDFLVALASDGNEVDLPTEGFRARLAREERTGNDLRTPHRLALLIKAFSLHCAGKRVGKKGLYLLDSEPYPQIEMITPAQLAAE